MTETPRYTLRNVAEVADSAPAFGFAESQESRFASTDLDCERTALSHHFFKPGRRQAFGHRHEQAEEVYFVVAGSGRVKLDDEIVELKPRDLLRVAPPVTRSFEAGGDGLEVLAFGRWHEGDGEVIQGWWSE
jgi:mannose-6-phosphate isomerase-like protein (cupin superfamily)